MATRPADEVSSWIWIAIGLAAALALMLILFPLLAGQPFPAQPAAPAARSVTVGQILDNPNAFVGETVVVTAETDRIVSPDAFTLDDPNPAVDRALLVFKANPDVTFPGLVKGNVVQVTGSVRIFRLLEIERDLGRDLDDSTYAGFEGQPVIMAQQISRATPTTLHLEW